MTDTRRRVKLYALNADRQWDDRGTGHVSSSYIDRLKGTSLLVRAESDGTILLESKIQPDTAYQKQQDTLIVWSESDNYDLALSFQEKAGCDEIWEKICQVQGKDPSVEITQDIVEESEDERFDDMSDSAPPIELPACELGRLEDINELIGNCLSSPMRKEKLAMALESEGYIRKLLNLFHTCEDLGNMEGLHHLYDIFKNIFLLNKNALFEVMFSDDTIFDVVGCLEYEPTLPQPKKHRQYLQQLAKFKQAIPITNAELLAKIHQTYRVQYIQDVVLPTPSVFEDNMLSTLSSFIFFNKVEIVTLIQDDEKFLTELFRQLTDENTPDSKRRDLVLFLKEFCNFSQNLQPQGKEAFYKTLTALGILPALEITLSINDAQTKTASIDILNYIVEYSPSVIRDYTLQQINNTEQDQMLVNVIVTQLINDIDHELGGAVQLAGILRLLLDPENMMASVNKSEKADFLNYFYKNSIGTLIAPLLANTIGDRPVREDYRTVQLLGLILELLSFCVEHHTYHIKNCILNKDLLRKILVLMKSTHTFLVLCALRFMRKIIALKDEFYNRYIIKGNLFAPVFDAFTRNNGRYNLLDSAILEMFEFIKLEDIKSLCSHVVENFSKELEAIDYVQTFKALKLSVPSILRNSRYRRDQRQLDEEEEMWFNEEEDFDEGEAVVPAATADLVPPTSAKKQPSSPNSVAGSGIVDNPNKDGSSPPHQQQHSPPQQQQQTILNNNTSNSNVSAVVAAAVTTTTVTTQQQINSGVSSTISGTNDLPVVSVTAEAMNSSATISAVDKTGSNIFKKGLVDYEGDSDEEDEESELSPTPKRQRLS
ncbi:serine/threonine-protein phosphatase 4 regulatory subunit 3 isoform X2 [Nasonia vitripennis]|uniref:WH1 domain-containing protein n=1 Tax=Nasonia vitripennis TaxID=7425 RepID=A0A7M7TDK2_NASVI|nr:serine/threonine-protein phosphatase 4 regulatory subunit 3 isoform X2 [Nasonia vitripennis]XP_032455717.1 serine/threonine-protein phosphatase 4 regulatory subunit 3 isoform X2 [Nasonia vitripennis]